MMDADRAQRAVEALRKPDASLANVANTVRQSIAEVIEELSASPWQPIATAPKDGTRILAFGIRDSGPIYEVTWWRRAEDSKGYIGWGEFNMQYWPPTHWMPLPDAPTS